MKTAKIFVILLSAFVLTACFDDPGTDIVWGDDAYLELDRAGQPNTVVPTIVTRVNDGESVPFNVQVNLMGRPQKEDVEVEFTITGTAIAGVQYNKITPGNTITIPAGENVANIEFEILDDNMNPGPAVGLIVTITGGDLPLSNYVAATFNLQVSCPSDLSGTYSFSTTMIVAGAGGAVCPATVTGTGTLTEEAGAAGNGRYSGSDFSFGMFACAWGVPNTAGSLRLVDICSSFTMAGIDRYGDSYSIDLVSVTATTLTIDWINTYGDRGRSALTRTDAKTWPLDFTTP